MLGGRCIIMPMPILALSSTGRWVMSLPLNSMVPDVTLIVLYPMMVAIRVDFPDPLGPKRTHVSPSFTVRFTPLRISLSPAVAWRSVIFSISAIAIPYGARYLSRAYKFACAFPRAFTAVRTTFQASGPGLCARVMLHPP